MPQIQPLLSIAIYRTTPIAVQTLNVSQMIAAHQVHANHMQMARLVQTVMCVPVNKFAQMDIVNGLPTHNMVHVPITTAVKVDFVQVNHPQVIHIASIKMVKHAVGTQIVFQIVAKDLNVKHLVLARLVQTNMRATLLLHKLAQTDIVNGL